MQKQKITRFHQIKRSDNTYLYILTGGGYGFVNRKADIAPLSISLYAAKKLIKSFPATYTYELI